MRSPTRACARIANWSTSTTTCCSWWRFPGDAATYRLALQQLADLRRSAGAAFRPLSVRRRRRAASRARSRDRWWPGRSRSSLARARTPTSTGATLKIRRLRRAGGAPGFAVRAGCLRQRPVQHAPVDRARAAVGNDGAAVADSRRASRLRLRRGFAAAWDAAEVPLRWALADSKRSTTHARLNVRPKWRSGFRRLAGSAPQELVRPLESIRLLPRREAVRVIDLARSALAARSREVHAMNYANPAEVHLADLGEGVELAVIGVPPRERLLLEANYGYLLLSNGVPIGYGGVSPLFRQANTGINVFDPFRGSEAAFLWVQTLRAFRTLFGVRRFIINGYQFGAGNSEAIASGAYWFYWRLGFRPSLPENVALAAEEGARLKKSSDAAHAGGGAAPTRARRPDTRPRRLGRRPMFSRSHCCCVSARSWHGAFRRCRLCPTRPENSSSCAMQPQRSSFDLSGEARAMSAMDSNASRRWLRCSISPHGRPASAMRCCSGCRRRVRRPSRSSPGSARGKFASFASCVPWVASRRNARHDDRSDRGGERGHAV